MENISWPAAIVGITVILSFTLIICIIHTGKYPWDKK